MLVGCLGNFVKEEVNFQLLFLDRETLENCIPLNSFREIYLWCFSLSLPTCLTCLFMANECCVEAKQLSFGTLLRFPTYLKCINIRLFNLPPLIHFTMNSFCGKAGDTAKN